MPKAIITGATGLLGRAIFASFESAGWEVVGTGLSRAGKGIVKLNLLDDAAIRELIEKESPDFIVHSAADRSPDSVAANPDLARQLNVSATTKLSILASLHRIPLLYISTDYVFPGVKGEAPYDENTSPRAPNLYGQLKLDGEKAVLDSGDIPFGAVLRLPVLYGHVDPDIGNKESAVNVLVDKVKDCIAGKKVVMDDWARRFPTNVQDIGNAIVQIGDKWLYWLQRKETGEQTPAGQIPTVHHFPRILQFSAKECFTKYEICRIFAEIMGEDISAMERDTSGGAGGGVSRPFDTQLATVALEKLIGGPLKTVSFREWWQRELQEHA